jgi:PAS domain S-box-containing protein
MIDVERADLAELIRYKILVDQIKDFAIYMIDPNGIIVSWNTGARHLKLYEDSEIIGKNFSVFYTEQDLATNLPVIALTTAARDGKFEGEGWRVRKDGTRFWAHVVIDALRDEKGDILGFAKIVRDLTEQVAATQQLDQAREALFESRKLEVIGHLTGGVAHDFNNLLTAVIGGLEMLGTRIQNDPESLRLLANVLAAAERGALLTQRMLAFARRQNLYLQTLNLLDLLYGMADLIESALTPGVSIELELPAGSPLVLADVNQIEMALLNLIINARDALSEGGLITVGLTSRTDKEAPGPIGPGNYVVLSVDDNGGGMSAQTLAKAIEPFFTTKPVGEGTGLGLAMIHGLAEQLGGALFLASEEGKGTTASIWLPAIVAAAKSSEWKGTKAPVPHVDNPLTILLVDDDPLVLAGTSSMLINMGHEVIECLSAPEALREFQNTPEITMVVTDYKMPYVTGIELIRKIKAGTPRMPVILATGYADIALDNEEVTVLAKPFRAIELERALHQAMERVLH